MLIPACAGTPASQAGNDAASEPRTENEAPAGSDAAKTVGSEGTDSSKAEAERDTARAEDTGTEKAGSGKTTDGGASSEKTAGEATDVTMPEGVPEYRDFYEDSGSEPIQIKNAGSAGAIPAVKPFNFGKDPGGPEDKTLYLDVPKIGLDDVPVYNSTSEEDLTRSTVHVPATGFPWQEGANVFIAGHRIGYEGTGSYHIFYDMDLMEKGDEISLTDADGKEYRYRMTSLKIVDVDNVEVMNPVEGKNIVTLQTCTLPDYKERVIVQGEMVEG